MRRHLAIELVVRSLLLLALLLAASRIVAPVSLDIRSGSLEVRVVPRLPGGKLIVPLGPLGQLSWNVDRAPVDIIANIQIDPNASSLPGADDIDLGDLRTRFLWSKLLWVMLFGIAGALLVVRSTSIKPSHAAAGGAIVATGVASFVVALGLLTFNDKALDDPRYKGPIRDVPRIMALIREIRRDYPGTRRNIARAVEGLARLRKELLSGGPSPQEPTTKLLVIGDLQSNPIGLILASRLARQFDVDGVLNTGDVTERGTTLEGALFAGFGSLGLPHVIAPGNHEDEDALSRMAKVPGVMILRDNADVESISGIEVLGAEDPNAAVIGADPDNDLAREQIPIICDALRGAAARRTPDVLMVHDRRIGDCASRDAIDAQRPLIFIWGHSEKQAYKQYGSVIHLSPGTSGGGGIKTPNDKPYGFALVEFDQATLAPTSVCLFSFQKPEELGEASCHVIARTV